MAKQTIRKHTVNHGRRGGHSRSTYETRRSGFGWMLLGVLVGVGLAGVLYIKSTNTPPAWWRTTEEKISTWLQQRHHHAVAMHDGRHGVTDKSAGNTSADNTAKPHFDFYTVLPSDQGAGQLAALPDDEPKKTVAVTPTNAAPVTQTAETPASTTEQSAAPNQSAPTSASAVPAAGANTTPTVANLPTPSFAQPTKLTQNNTKINKKVAAHSSASDHGAPVVVGTKLPSRYLLQVAIVNSSADAERMKAEMGMMGIQVKMQAMSHGRYKIVLGPYKSKQSALAMQQQLQASAVQSELKTIG